MSRSVACFLQWPVFSERVKDTRFMARLQNNHLSAFSIIVIGVCFSCVVGLSSNRASAACGDYLQHAGQMKKTKSSPTVDVHHVANHSPQKPGLKHAPVQKPAIPGCHGPLCQREPFEVPPLPSKTVAPLRWSELSVKFETTELQTHLSRRSRDISNNSPLRGFLTRVDRPPESLRSLCKVEACR